MLGHLWLSQSQLSFLSQVFRLNGSVEVESCTNVWRSLLKSAARLIGPGAVGLSMSSSRAFFVQKITTGLTCNNQHQLCLQSPGGKVHPPV